MKRRLTLAAVAAVLGISFSYTAVQRPQADHLGIIILHGKLGSPTERRAGLANLARALLAVGYLADVPLMPWNEQGWNHFDTDVLGAFALIDSAAESLRRRGAQRIVIVGHSQGANVALAYAVTRGSLAGLVMAAPGHRPEAALKQDTATRSALLAARTMIESGKSEQPFVGPDGIQGYSLTLETTAKIYFSWMDSAGLASMETQAPRLSPTIPLLMVISWHDPFFPAARSLVFEPAARHPYSKYLPVGGDHSTTPAIASNLIRNWIEGLPAQASSSNPPP
jgi:pimeloyl-ACP methyl ester carboxylesterase